MVVPTDEAKPDNNKSAVFAEVKLGKLPEIQEEGRRKKKSGAKSSWRCKLWPDMMMGKVMVNP